MRKKTNILGGAGPSGEKKKNRAVKIDKNLVPKALRYRRQPSPVGQKWEEEERHRQEAGGEVIRKRLRGQARCGTAARPIRRKQRSVQ